VKFRTLVHSEQILEKHRKILNFILHYDQPETLHGG